MISIGKKKLNLTLFEKIILQQQPVTITAAALKEVVQSYDFLQSFSKDKLIYGINTGFGPMVQYRIADTDRQQLQYNLIRSHSSGMGQLLSQQHTRALMLARLNTLLLGYSGIHADAVQLLADLINNEAYPCIYAHGGVGASGDLVQLAHLALGLIGEGDFWYKGKIETAATVFKKLQLQPLKIYTREGLAILNGTSAMTGIGGVNTLLAERLVVWSTLFSLVLNEVMEAFDDHFSTELNAVKQHEGQQRIALWMRRMGAKSKLLKKRNDLYDKKIIESVVEERVQEYYSLRCIPQILGPILDTVTQAKNTIENELNSVNDNPIVDRKNKNIFHGGNFHGDYISLEMDKLKIAITKLSMLTERQLNFILNPALNQKLPAFANAGTLGLNFGIQGMQYPATSTVAENQALSTPMYIHSIPNNNDNQDVVSMGCNAALLCDKVIDNTFEVMSVALAALAQAIDITNVHDKLSIAGRWLHSNVRTIMPFFKQDAVPAKKLQQLKVWLTDTDIISQFQKELK